MNYDYDVTVIGGGAAGLTAAGVAASLGAKTALVEEKKLGGDCTWYGCIPSKTLLKAAKAAHTIRHAARFGIETHGEISINFETVMRRVHEVQQQIYQEADAPEIYEKMGVTVLYGKAAFVDEHTITIETGQSGISTLQSKNVIIATGSRPITPPIPGLEKVSYVTNEQLFSLKKQPRQLLILGAGPIGIEMGQAFCRLGSKVHVFDAEEHILPKDHPELTAILQKVLEQEGMTFHLQYRVTQVDEMDGIITVTAEEETTGRTIQLTGDALLVAAGRAANTENLNLEAAGVTTHKRGITVNQYCQTSRSHIYACGDVAGGMQFTHIAEHMAKIAAGTMLTHLPLQTDDRHIPWCSYTEPEIAHVGETEAELHARHAGHEVYRFPFNRIDRAITEDATEGWIRIYAAEFDGKIFGADILGAHAGELISEIGLAMRNGITLRQLSDTIHPYPSYALGNRRAADQWYVRKQSGTIVGLLQFFFGYQGQKPDTSDPDRIV
ncbi:pyridine nucleotide-disulphide oxidoreductase dimerisation region [Prosthecochloris aestuarii DSM 271]|uniref:Dihydrolipoyl dehydrogenase n=1 Tax=Prosthecochloris aestuarii (strain DSM 271 / SK 413) TaxID=290512 RepID=B4S878_PROA2|nr:dihydrolipoyl dehydrogenase [Prosthecochloris aestuarii]ACF46265.1 pyridine nucleotide-disulphide oxidoreductase dimerisation region [Prosthecochloris aestuarii DSM 271]